MNKEQFLATLNHYLNRLSDEEKADILHDFHEHFEIGLANGKTEEDIARALGQPAQIAKELLANYHFEKATETATTGNVFRAVWAAIGLSFFNLIFVLGPFIGLAGIIFAGWITGGSFLMSPVLALLKYSLHPLSFIWFEFFLSVAISGIGMFLLIGMYYVTKFAYKGFIRYLKFNARIVKGGMKNA